MRTTGELEQNGYKMCITIFPADWKLKFLFKTTHGCPEIHMVALEEDNCSFADRLWWAFATFAPLQGIPHVQRSGEPLTSVQGCGGRFRAAQLLFDGQDTERHAGNTVDSEI